MNLELFFRGAFALTLIGNILISALFRLRARRTAAVERRQESTGMQLARVLVTLPVLAAMVCTLAVPRWMQWSLLELPSVLRWAGVGLGAALMPFTGWTLRSIGTNVTETVLTKRDHQLVTHGPYRYVRHPLYSGGIGLILALGLMASSGLFLAFAVMAAGFIKMGVLPAEERNLLAAFGEEYERYRHNTGALLPKL